MAEENNGKPEAFIDSDGEPSKLKIPEELSLLPLRDAVLFPLVVSPITAGRESSVALIDDAITSGNRIVAVTAQKDPSVDKPALDDVYRIGTAVVIHTMMRVPDGMRLIVQGIKRIKVLETTQDEPYLRARVQILEEKTDYTVEERTEIEALRRNIMSLFQKVIALSPSLPDELQNIPTTMIAKPSLLADTIATNLPLPTMEKQQLLELVDIRERMSRLMTFLNREVEVLEIGSRIQSRVQSEMTKTQRDYYLREQMKAIQRELGEADERTSEVQELRQKIEEAKMPEEARKAAERELERLERIPPASPEHTVARTYVDWLVAIPWSKSTEDNLDIVHVKQVLDEDHFGLEKVKQRILEYLSVRKFREGDIRQPILCFVGPPGVGKTSLGMSIARALGRKFIRLSLGGIRDEAEIRGHRRTYIGALPGQIIQGVRRAGSNNPVFMMDEVDKVGADFRGDPSAALLEVLDPEQNITFRDNFLEVPYDLSRTLFITTANLLDPILPPLRDRMEILEIAGYTEEEKLQICRRHLIPKQLAEHGLKLEENITFEDDALRTLIRGYTREAGVRNLEREIAAICRKVTREFAEGRTEPVRVDTERVNTYLGAPRYQHEEVINRTQVPGVATGLAWTPVGGDVLFVEATQMPGKRELMLTGMLGDVMKESAQAALSYIRSHAADLDIDPEAFASIDIHLHVPAGAIPKDGPSAGITIATALASLMTGRLTKPDTAMTGEITLTGRVLPVGGIKEKVLAARRAGIKRIILPRDNRKDMLEDVPEEIRQEIDFELVGSVDEVFKAALEPLKARSRAKTAA